jgi:predicted RNA-binding protein with PIN domain
VRLLVDGMNVIGSRPDGWWRDRKGAMRKLVESLDAYGEATGDEITVVFDGKPFDLPTGRVRASFAAGGRNAADHEIARIVAGDREPAAISVVTSDAELAERVRAAGAQVASAGSFRRRLDEPR